jgi:hypothetical protein
MRALVHAALTATFASLLVVAACSNNAASCSAPSTGTFHVSLAYSQTLAVDLFCDAGGIDASACSARPHPLDGASWTIAVDGSTAKITGTAAGFSCAATAPQTSPSTAADGSTAPGSGCYLLVECGQQAVGDAGAGEVQVQLLAQASTDALVLVHDGTSDCCTDEYTGTWH